MREALLSTDSVRALSLKFGISRPAITALLEGRTYQDIHPELPRQGTRPQITCHSCRHWSGEKCKLGFPDPLEDGLSVAADCLSYAA